MQEWSLFGNRYCHSLRREGGESLGCSCWWMPVSGERAIPQR